MRVGRRPPREPLCWHQQCPRTPHAGTNYSQRAHPGRDLLRCCGRLNSRAASGFLLMPGPANLASKVEFWSFQVGQPSAILILPALVNRMPPKLPQYILARSAGLCARMGCDASSLWRRLAMRRIFRALTAAQTGPSSEYALTADRIKPELARSQHSR